MIEVEWGITSNNCSETGKPCRELVRLNTRLELAINSAKAAKEEQERDFWMFAYAFPLFFFLGLLVGKLA